MRSRQLLSAVAILAFAFFFSACSRDPSEMKDGYYTAEAVSFNSIGWKEYVVIYVSGGKIITVEYDAFNASGFVKSWDIGYMRVMKQASGTYPNDYARSYAVSLMNWQNADYVDAVTGATHSHVSFRLLAEAAIDKAKAGDNRVALVDLDE